MASSKESGRGDGHRSGFHSQESGPQRVGSRLMDIMETTTSVSFGTVTWVISPPSTPLIGVEKGNIISSRALKMQMVSNIYQR